MTISAHAACGVDEPVHFLRCQVFARASFAVGYTPWWSDFPFSGVGLVSPAVADVTEYGGDIV
jgi:hypothetical protein